MKLLRFICYTAAIAWLVVGFLFAFGPQSLAWLGALWTPLALVAWVCVTLINILD